MPHQPDSDLRFATAEQSDIPSIRARMAVSMAKLLPDVLTPDQVERSHESMGVDTTLIEDRTYFLVYLDAVLVGCGGWSRRRTLYGGNHTQGRDDTLADPASEPAKIRAMYTHPDYTRRGIGHALLRASEAAARAEGFRSMELGATASGLLLYKACGYEVIEDLSQQDEEGVVVPVIRMGKRI